MNKKIKSIIVAVPFLLCMGVVFNWWSGTNAMIGIIGYGMILLIVARSIKQEWCVSGVFSLTVLVGFLGIVLALAEVHGSLSLLGLVLAGFALIVIKKIGQRGWVFEMAKKNWSYEITRKR